MEVYSTHFRRLSPKPSKMSDFHLMGHNFQLMRKPTLLLCRERVVLAAAACASATHASVAGAAAGHDGSAGGAGG
jgi:hypothetical protein